MSSDITFSVDGVSQTQCNPLSLHTPLPAGSTWYYYYYLCPTNSVQVQVSNPKGLELNLCIFAQGGAAGSLILPPVPPPGYTMYPGLAGGGGGGEVLNMSEFALDNFSIVLQPLSSSNNLPCQLIPQLDIDPINIKSGSGGGAPKQITINSNGQASGGQGGNGGNGGGAAGNCGAGGSIYYTGTSPATINIYPNPYTGPIGGLGTGYNPSNTGQTLDNTPNSTVVNFADGTSANIAQAGKQMNAGNGAGFLIYYQRLDMAPPLV